MGMGEGVITAPRDYVAVPGDIFHYYDVIMGEGGWVLLASSAQSQECF